jgi:hypothetical protein
MQGKSEEKQRKTRIRAALHGVASKYAICPECKQEVIGPWRGPYRRRWRMAKQP